MSAMNLTRSQAILFMPVENITAVLTLHDGERVECMLFVPDGEDVTQVVGDGTPFIPVVRRGRVCLIARAAIACVAVSPRLAGQGFDDDLPFHTQKASIKLRSGTVIEGELKWIPPEPRKRTSDYLNAEQPYFVVHGAETVHFIVKAHVATVTEG
jgi:hypothetical protein